MKLFNMDVFYLKPIFVSKSGIHLVNYYVFSLYSICVYVPMCINVCLCVSVADSNARLYTRRDWQIVEVSQFDQIQVPVIEAAVFSLHHTAKFARCANRHEGLVISVASSSFQLNIWRCLHVTLLSSLLSINFRRC